MKTIEKIKIAREVLNKGKRISDTAKKHYISASTVRRYMDAYCDGKYVLDLEKELDDLRLHTHCAKEDDPETLARRLDYIDDTLQAIASAVNNTLRA